MGRINKLRLYAAGLVAFLIGVPLTEKALGQTGDIIWSSFNLAAAIADSAGQS
ncbi:MAG: hypothetical protein AB1716_01880 [Planctomycetota bacterium]